MVETEINPKDVHMNNLHEVLIKAVNQAGQDDLAQHLRNLFGFLLLHYPGQAYEKFEEASYLLKNKADINKFLKTFDIRDYSKVAENEANYIVEM